MSSKFFINIDKDTKTMFIENEEFIDKIIFHIKNDIYLRFHNFLLNTKYKEFQEYKDIVNTFCKKLCKDYQNNFNSVDIINYDITYLGEIPETIFLRLYWEFISINKKVYTIIHDFKINKKVIKT